MQSTRSASTILRRISPSPPLVLDSDPRRVTKTGSAQPSDATNDLADNEPTADAETDPAQAAPDEQD